MVKSLFILFALYLSGIHCLADVRWCSVSGTGDHKALAYPPIGIAARIPGVVLARVLFTPDGHVTAVEPISGPRLLVTSVQGQLKDWSLKTTAIGDDLCQTLVIATFKIINEGDSTLSSSEAALTPGLIRFTIAAKPVYLNDPPMYVTRASRLRRFWSHVSGS